MSNLHATLLTQLQRAGLHEESGLQDREAWGRFLGDVDRAYRAAERYRESIRSQSGSREPPRALRTGTENNQRLSAVLDSLSDAICVLFPDWTIESLNRAAEGLLHVTEQEGRGKNLNHLITLLTDDRKSLQFEQFQTVINAGHPVTGNARLIRSDGTMLIVMYAVHPVIENGELTSLVFKLTDVTQQITAKAALVASEQRYRALIDYSPHAIGLAKNGILEFVNPAGRALLAGSWAQFNPTGHSVREFLDETLLLCFKRGAEDTQTNVQTREGKVRCADGSELYLEITSIPSDEGTHDCVQFVARDVTQRRLSEEHLRELNKRLIDASHRAGMAEIASGVLHNVGNVLNSVNVAAELIAEKFRTMNPSGFGQLVRVMKENENDLASYFLDNTSAKQIPNYLQLLHESMVTDRNELVTEILQLIKHISHMKAIVSMQQTYARAGGLIDEVNVQDIIDEAIKINEASFRRHAIDLRVSCEDMPIIRIDRHRVLQILVNLISNARQAVRDVAPEMRVIEVQARKKTGDRLQICVRDQGVGILPENLKKVFSVSFTTKKDGHGFGLHSSALAASELGGFLQVYSAGSGKGATFTLELPFGPQTKQSL